MASRRRGSRLGNLLVLFGLLTISGLIFGAGVYTGRHWPATPPAVSASAVKTPAEQRAERGRTPDPPAGPTLTFYQELKAPLTAPPPPARTAKKPAAPPVAAPEPTTSDAPRAGEQQAMHAPPTAITGTAGAGASATPAAKSDPGGAGFTVQVGAYRARPPAETLRASLAAAGHDARVIEVEGPAARYRVRVGAFATREAARDAAARLAGERSLSTFVTTR